MMSSKYEQPSYCPYCGKPADYKFTGDGREDDNVDVFRTISDVRDFAVTFDEDEDEVPELITDMVARALPYYEGVATAAWFAVLEITGDGFFVYDDQTELEMRCAFNEKIKRISKRELALIFARYGYVAGLVYREYLKHGGKRLASMRGY